MAKNKQIGSSQGHQFYAGLSGSLSGKISNSNQYFIILSASLLILIGILLFFFSTAPKLIGCILVITIILLFCSLIIGLKRQCKINPLDELNQFAAKVVGADGSYEIKAPNSLVPREIFTALIGLTYPENEAPMGIIQGDVNDKNSIKLLNETERQEIIEKEKKEIQERVKDLACKVGIIKLKVDEVDPETKHLSAENSA